MSIEILEKEAKILFPQSETLRIQWIKTTKELMDSGKHAKFTGGFEHSDAKWYKPIGEIK